MTPRERFLTAIRGEMPDRIPLVLWNNKLPGGDVDAQIFELDVCLVVKSCVWKQSLEGIDVVVREEPASDGDTRRHTTYRTPAGDLTTVERLMDWTVWIEKFPFSSPEDYDALEALIASRRYEADFERFTKDDGLMGDQSIARPTSIHSPMHELIYEFMGIEVFSIEYAERRERLLHLENILKEDWRRRVAMTAESPVQYAVIEGNTEISMIGPERFEWYYHPCIEEACAMLHEKDIIAGAHLDGNNKRLAELIARTSLDLIESFTPAPETDMSIAEAREAWPDKALQTHFPSSIHHKGKAGIEEWGEKFLEHAVPGGGFIIGQSEDIPNRGKETLVPMFRYFRESGILPLSG